MESYPIEPLELLSRLDSRDTCVNTCFGYIFMPEYNPSLHCGAKNRKGTPCSNRKGFGTNHVGTGRCKFHGGMSTGAITKKGREANSDAQRKHGFFATVVIASDRKHLKKLQEFSPSEIIKEGGELVYVRLMNIFAEKHRFKGQVNTLMEAARMMEEQEQLTPEFVKKSEKLLTEPSIEKLAKIIRLTATLFNTAASLDKMENIKKQVDILKDFLVEVMKTSGDHNVRALGANAIQMLRLEAGLPIEEFDRLIASGIKDD